MRTKPQTPSAVNTSAQKSTQIPTPQVGHSNRFVNADALRYVDHLPYRSGMHRLLMLELAMFCNRETLEIFPSQETLARKLMVGERHVRRLADHLVEDKLLKVENAGKINGGRGNNHYTIIGLDHFLAHQKEAALNAWEAGKAALDSRFDIDEQSGSGQPVQTGSVRPTNKEGEYISGNSSKGEASTGPAPKNEALRRRLVSNADSFEVGMKPRLILLALAWYASRNGINTAFPLGELAYRCEMTERTVRKHLKRLVDLGLAHVEDSSAFAVDGKAVRS